MPRCFLKLCRDAEILDDTFTAVDADLTFAKVGSRGSIEQSFIWGYYGTQYRVRLYPPFGYSILYQEHNLTRCNHQKNTTQFGFGVLRG